MMTLSRIDVAELCGISLPQLEYFAKVGVAAPDVGGMRKKFSIREMRVIVLASAALMNGTFPASLVAPIGWLRDAVSTKKWADTFDLACRGNIELYFMFTCMSDKAQAFLSTTLQDQAKFPVCTTISIHQVFAKIPCAAEFSQIEELRTSLKRLEKPASIDHAR